MNVAYYGKYPSRFSQWDAVKRVALYPSMFGGPYPFVQQTPCGNCSVRLQHFIAYVRADCCVSGASACHCVSQLLTPSSL
eukprot:COSAG04_NODE_584_length_12354_cov_29.554141_5_plen_80_part_00